MILFGCYKCQATYQASDDMGGDAFTCEKCGHELTISEPVLPRLQALLAARPFKPFLVVLPCGQQYVVITHPELCVIEGEQVNIEFTGNAAAERIGLSVQVRPRDPDRCLTGWHMPAFMIRGLAVIE